MTDLPEWANRLAQATDHPPDDSACAECQAWLPALVDAELAGGDVASLYPKTLAHLSGCENCDATYAAMLDLALAEAEGRLPQPASYPEVQLPPQVQLRRLTGQLLDTIFATLAPARLAQLGDSLQTFFAQLSSLPPGQLPVAQPGPDTDAATAATAAASAETQVMVRITYEVLAELLAQYTAAELRALSEQGALANKLRQLATHIGVHLVAHDRRGAILG